MNKVYIIIPLIGLMIFGGFYLRFDKQYAAKQADKQLKIENERKEKAKRDIANREAAIKAAVEAQAKRKIEREERERLEEAKKTARQEAEDRRQHAYDERNKLREKTNRLKKDLDEVNAAIKDIVTEKERLLKEDQAQKDYVKVAESNVKYYYDLLDKITAAEKAAAEAALAAAAAKKS